MHASGDWKRIHQNPDGTHPCVVHTGKYVTFRFIFSARSDDSMSCCHGTRTSNQRHSYHAYAGQADNTLPSTAPPTSLMNFRFCPARSTTMTLINFGRGLDMEMFNRAYARLRTTAWPSGLMDMR